MSEDTKEIVKRGPKDKTSELNAEVSRADSAHANPKRPRIPMGVGLNFEYPEHKKDPDYFYYGVSQENVDRRMDAGFEFVLNDDGSKFQRKGRDGSIMYCMRQHMDYRNEDLQLKSEMRSATMKAEQKLLAGEYLPEGRTSKVQRDTDLIDPLLG